MDGWKEGMMDGWIDGCIDRWMGGSMGIWMDIWMEVARCDGKDGKIFSMNE